MLQFLFALAFFCQILLSMVFFLFFSFVIFTGKLISGPCLVRGLAGGADCSDGGTFSHHTKRCYKYYATPLPCTEARTKCADDNSGGDLASIPDQETHDLLFSLTSGLDTWVGGHKSQHGAWGWSDGTPWGYTNWNQGEPNGVGDECLRLKQPTGRWADRGEDLAFTFICQYEGISNLPGKSS